MKTETEIQVKINQCREKIDEAWQIIDAIERGENPFEDTAFTWFEEPQISVGNSLSMYYEALNTTREIQRVLEWVIDDNPF